MRDINIFLMAEGNGSPDIIPTSKSDFFRETQTDSGPEIVGNQIIGPTARKVGEIDNKSARERGYLDALGRSAGDNNDPNRPQNVQAIIDAAKEAGVPLESIWAKLKELKIPYQKSNQPKALKPSTPEIQRTGNPFDWRLINYDQIAEQTEIKQIIKRDGLLMPPAAGNMFGDQDSPTLAGKALAEIYDKLTKRVPSAPSLTPVEVRTLVEAQKSSISQFAGVVKEINESRIKAGKPPLIHEFIRTAGSDGFHQDGNKSVDFPYYFNKSTTRWKNPEAALVRGYITLDNSELNNQRHFVDLCQLLYDSGIDFTAKASGEIAARDRTDNIVLYISGPDQARARVLIIQFLKERSIGKGHMTAAFSSPQDGLSWAMEPDKTQNALYKTITGSTKDASFNTFVAALATPRYLERIAEQLEAKIKQITDPHVIDAIRANIERCRQEAQRVRGVISTIK